MKSGERRDRPARTVLEQLIWERRETLEEFADFATKFAQEHGEPATLSVRHLARLVSGRGDGGKPLGRPQPATARLLERIFDLPIQELLAATSNFTHDTDAIRIHELMEIASRVDASTLDILRNQLDSIRRLDRQFGVRFSYAELIMKINQTSKLMSFSLTPHTRRQLATLLAEMNTLAGWQALDMGNMTKSWQHYEEAKSAARESGDISFEVYASTEQSFTLIELGENAKALDLIQSSKTHHLRKISPLLRAWISAAHGEALAINNKRSESRRAYDSARSLLAQDSTGLDGPYLSLNAAHLDRWQGSALARTGDPGALEILTIAHSQMDPSFTRATASLHVDFARAFLAIDNQESMWNHISNAHTLATITDSRRIKSHIRNLKRKSEM